MLKTYRQTAEISSVNLRNELHGDDKVGAVDIGISMTVPNTFLLMFGPHLLGMFYRSATSGQAELLEHLPDLRAPELGMPIKHEYVGSGYEVELNYGMNHDKALRFADCQVDKIKLDMKAGGSVDVSLRILAHPKPKDVGALYELNGSEIELSLLPPEKGADEQVAQSGLFEQPDFDEGSDEADEQPATNAAPRSALFARAAAAVRATGNPTGSALAVEFGITVVEAAALLIELEEAGVIAKGDDSDEYFVVAEDDAA